MHVTFLIIIEFGLSSLRVALMSVVGS